MIPMVSIEELRKKYVGLQSELEEGTDHVERGAVRRHAQACMDENQIYSIDTLENEKYGGPVAPPLFPPLLFRRAFGSPDPVQENAHSPEFDGLTHRLSLPPIEEIKHLKMLNGGTEIEFFRYARMDEAVTQQTRYADIFEKETSRGRMIFVVTEIDYRTKAGEPLLRVRSTLLWR